MRVLKRGLACLAVLVVGPQLLQAGSIVAWGDDFYGQPPNAPTGAGFTAIAGGVTNNGYALLTSDVSGPAVPEPSSIALLLMGGVGLVGYGLRRKTRLTQPGRLCQP